MIRILFFGPVAERVGTRVLHVEHRPGRLLGELRDELAAQHPEAFAIACFAAVDGVQVRDMSRVLEDTSEVAFMARFSGG